MTEPEKHTPPDLRTRWSASIGSAVNDQLLRGLPKQSPFGTTLSGRADLRGLVIKVFVRGVSLKQIDFSFCEKEWAGQFDFCTFENCLFVDSILPANLGSSFASCQFSGAKLRDAVLRGRFEKCDFSKTDLSSALGTEVTFQNCDFTDSNLRKAQLTDCHFIDCRFAGARFGSGSFGRSEFRSCDIDLARLGNTMIEGMKVDS